MVQLSKLRKAYSIGGKATPPGWGDAVRNYYGSPLSKYTMADMAVRYSVFKNSSLNNYKNPVNHVNSGGSGNGTNRETDHEKNNKVLKDFVDRNMAPTMFGDVPDVREEPE